MNARYILEYLTATDLLGFVFGVVREDESVLAFGTVSPTGEKVIVGSISHVCDDHFLVLSIDSTEEYRADTLADAYWFLWKLEECKNWETSSDWMREVAA